MKVWTVEFDVVFSFDGEIDRESPFSDSMNVVADSGSRAFEEVKRTQVGEVSQTDDGKVCKIEEVHITGLTRGCEVDLIATDPIAK